MSDEGVPCYRRMSAPSSAEELEEAAGYLRDAARCVQSAADRLHYMEAKYFGSALNWCHHTLLTVSEQLDERARAYAKEGQTQEASRSTGHCCTAADFEEMKAR